MKVPIKAYISNKQWKDVLSRLSYLEEQENQRQDNIPSIEKSFQMIELQVDDCNKRRQDQFLALQENNMLLLKRILSFEDKVANTVHQHEQDLKRIKKNNDVVLRNEVSEPEQKRVKVEEEENIVSMSKTTKKETCRKRCVECHKKMATLHKQIQKMKTRLSQSQKYQQYKMIKRLEEQFESQATGIKGIKAAHISSLKLIDVITTIVDQFCENDNNIADRFCEILGIKSKDINDNNQISDEGTKKKRKLATMLSEYGSDSESQEGNMESMLVGSKGDGIGNDGETVWGMRWREMVATQTKFLEKMTKHQDDSKNKIDEISVKVKQMFQEMIDDKMKPLETEIASKNQQSLENNKTVQSNLDKLESTLNLKFKENYESQLKLLTINMNRKFKELSRKTKTLSLPGEHEHAQQTGEMDDDIYQQNVLQVKVRDVPDTSQIDVKAIEEVIENRIRKLLDQLRVEMDDGFRIRIETALEKERGDIVKILQKDIEKCARNLTKDHRILINTELDQKFQMHMHTQNTRVLKLVKEECTKWTSENEKQKSCLYAELEERVQALLQKHYSAVAKLTIDEIMKGVQEDIEKHAQMVCDEERSLLEAKLEEKFQRQIDTISKMERKEVMKMLQGDIEKCARSVSKEQRTLFEANLDQKFQIHFKNHNVAISKLVKEQCTKAVEGDIKKHVTNACNEQKMWFEMKFEENFEKVSENLAKTKINQDTKLWVELEEDIKNNVVNAYYEQKKWLAVELEQNFQKQRDTLAIMEKKQVMKLLEDDIEMLVIKACNENKTWIEMELEEYFQKQSKKLAAFEKNEVMKLLEEDIENCAKNIYNGHRTQLEIWLDQKLEIRQQKQNVIVPVLVREELAKLVGADFQKIVWGVSNQQRRSTLPRAGLDSNKSFETRMVQEQQQQGSLESEFEKTVMTYLWEPTQQQLVAFKHEITTHFQAHQEYAMKVMQAGVEKKIQECSNYFQTHLDSLLEESVKSQRTDLLAALDAKYNSTHDSLFESLYCTLGKRIWESNNAQLNDFQKDLNEKLEDSVRIKIVDLRAEMEQTIKSEFPPSRECWRSQEEVEKMFV